MSLAWQKIADLSSGSSGGNTTSGTNPILSDVGILVYRGYVSNSDIRDFVVPGDQDQNNGDGSYTFRFKMPYDGWFLGYTLTGKTDVPMQIGSYVSRLDPTGKGDDAIHVDPNTLPAVNLHDTDVVYFADNPPFYPKDYRVAMKLNFGYLNGGQSGNIDVQAYLHLQYNPESVAAVASLQAPQAPYVPAPTTSTPTTTAGADVALVHLGHFYCKDGETPTDSGSAQQFQDTYIDANDQSVKAINNSRFAPFEGYITSAAICQQQAVNVNLYVNIMTAAGTWTMTIPAGQAHTEITFGPTQYHMNQGDYFYANFYADAGSLGTNPISLTCDVTLTPASNQ